jgi:hypothetical protein
MNLVEHHVPGSKDTYYIPNFVTIDEEVYLLRKVRAESTFDKTFDGHNFGVYCVDPGEPAAEMEATF